MRKMIKTFFGVGFLVLLTVFLTACSQVLSQVSSGSLERIIQKGKLVISTEADYPPQSEKVQGAVRLANSKCSATEFTANQFTGFDVDLAVEIAKRLGVEACFVTPSWEQVVAGNWNDRWDINVGSMTITKERAQVLYFPQPYSTGPAVFLVNKDDTRFNQPGDLSGKKIGVCAECPSQFYLDRSLELPGGAPINFVVNNPIIVAYKDDPPALKVLGQGQGRLDAILMDEMDGLRAIKDGAPLKQVGQPVFYGYVSVAIDKQSSRDQMPYFQKVNEIIQTIHKDGVLMALSEKYYGVDLTTVASQFDIHSLGQLP